MKRLMMMALLLAASIMFASCEPAANTTNKPANAPANNAAATAPAANTAAVEADIKKMVADVYTALAKNDADALDRFYADNYVLVDLDGSVKTKAARLAELRSGDVKFESLTADEISVRTNPEGTGAVSIARATAKSVSEGVVTDGHVRVTTVWSKTGDGWKAVSAHATRITPAAPADDKSRDEAPKVPANAPANK